MIISLKRRKMADFPTLVSAYSDAELSSPQRSTVPLLEYWSQPVIRLHELSRQMGVNLSGVSEIAFEYTVRPPRGSGRSSQTDLMLLADDLAVAVEGKSQEPSYLNVEEWMRNVPSDNHRDVLDGWLDLINKVAGSALVEANVRGLTYQLIHRAASACYARAPRGAYRAVVYQCFESQPKDLDKYRVQLTELRNVLGPGCRLGLFLICVPFQCTLRMNLLRDDWKNGNRQLASGVRAGLMSTSLFRFGDASVEAY